MSCRTNYIRIGVDKDLIEAYVWSNLSATASTGSDRTELEQLRNYIGSQLSPEDLKLAQQKKSSSYDPHHGIIILKYQPRGTLGLQLSSIVCSFCVKSLGVGGVLGSSCRVLSVLFV